MAGSHRPQGCQSSFTALPPPTGSGYFVKYITTVVIGWIYEPEELSELRMLLHVISPQTLQGIRCSNQWPVKYK